MDSGVSSMDVDGRFILSWTFVRTWGGGLSVVAWKGRGAEFGVSDFPDCSRAGERCEANAPSLTPSSLLPESGALSPPGLCQRLANILC